MTKTSRVEWADALRVLACLMVVGIHVCGVGWYSLPADGLDWNVANVLDSALRGAVPLFFMLSGAFLLEKDPEPRALLRRTLRLALLWLIFALLYSVRDDGFWLWRLPLYWLSEATDDHYHLWFLRTMVCLYLISPALRALVVYKDGKWVPWALGVFLLFGVLRSSVDLPLHPGATLVRARRLFIPELCGYSGYFLLGWFLKNRVGALTRGKKALCALLYLLAWALIALGTRYYSIAGGVNDERLYEYQHLPVFVEAVCLFLLAREGRPTALRRGLARLAPLTLGVYLLHPLMLDLLRGHVLGDALPKYVFIPAAVCAAALSAGLLTWLLRRIPFVRRFL